ncbi:MAG TPA: HAD-IB family phosphatase [Longimicrobiales bacterium]|nr:HAD-IB family phosphatase [Longimicrobiales bacterium]
MRRLRRVSGVVFDCDSTLSAIEGIDELAGPHRREIEELTDAAMRGAVPLESVYGRRLEIIRPTRRQVEALARQYVERLVPDAAEVVRALLFEGVDVRIMSGGLLPAVEAVGEALGLPAGKVSAVGIHFHDDGTWAGYEARSPLARSGGKHEVMTLLRREIGGPVIMVGDGMTDLEAAGVADLFVAYAGVVLRPAVVAEADVVIRGLSLAPVLPLALGGEPARSAAVQDLYSRGLSLLEEEYRAFFTYSNGGNPE